MKIKAFLYLPDTDIAFDNLHANPHSYHEIIKELYVIKYNLKAKKEYELYYDSDNINNFLNVAKGLITDPYLTGITNQLQTIISANSTNINVPHLRKKSCIYANWHRGLNLSYSPVVIAESAESKSTDTEIIKTICICLGNSLNLIDEELHIVRDNLKVKNDRPNIITLPIIYTDISFIKWISTISGNEFILKDNADFEPLEKFWGKERIYRQKSSGNFWYFDFFHKNNKIHYEIFDSTGDIHLGEADQNGVLIPNSVDAKKKISNLL